MNRDYAFLLWALGLTMLLGMPRAWSQSGQDAPAPSVSGNVGILWQSYAEDSLIGAVVPPSKTGYNAFANVLYNQGNFSAGMRYESYLNAVIGFPGRFNGSGIGYRFARYNDPDRGVDVTVGNFYDQFGSGLVFRSYEERNLGIDNAMDGFRLILKPIDGVQAKFIYGKQRFDFDNGLVNGPGVVRAVDLETDLNALVEGWKEKPLKVTAAASFVSKFQAGSPFSVDSLVLAMPQNIGSWSYRINAIRKGWTASAEHAEINDPSADNGHVPHGEAFPPWGTAKGLGVLFTAKMVDNMSFRSDRDLRLFDLPINHSRGHTTAHVQPGGDLTLTPRSSQAKPVPRFSTPFPTANWAASMAPLSASLPRLTAWTPRNTAINPWKARCTDTSETAGGLGTNSTCAISTRPSAAS